MRVGGDSAECDHPPDELEYLGDDGRNVYVECSRCAAVFVVSNGVDRLAEQT